MTSQVGWRYFSMLQLYTEIHSSTYYWPYLGTWTSLNFLCNFSDLYKHKFYFSSLLDILCTTLSLQESNLVKPKDWEDLFAPLLSFEIVQGTSFSLYGDWGPSLSPFSFIPPIVPEEISSETARATQIFSHICSVLHCSHRNELFLSYLSILFKLHWWKNSYNHYIICLFLVWSKNVGRF